MLKIRRNSKYDYEQIAADIRKGLSYTDIMYKHGVKSRSTINSVKRKYNIRTSEIGNQLIRKKKLQDISQEIQIIKESKKLAVSLVDSHNNFTNIANKAMSIIEEYAQQKTENSKSILKLISVLETTFAKSDCHPSNLKSIIDDLNSVLRKIEDPYRSAELQLKAIKEFKDIQRIFIEIEGKLRDFNGLQNLFKAIFYGFKILPDNKYLKYRNFVIQNCPEARPYFLHYEGISNYNQDAQNQQDD